jgi:hypothetical protein
MLCQERDREALLRPVRQALADGDCTLGCQVEIGIALIGDILRQLTPEQQSEVADYAVHSTRGFVTRTRGDPARVALLAGGGSHDEAQGGLPG